MKGLLLFGLGAALGSLLTWKLIEEKYKKIADDEIESVIEYFKNKKENEGDRTIAKDNTEIIKLEDKESKKKSEYEKTITDLEYADDDDATIIMEPTEEYVAPYIITPDEFCDSTEFEAVAWSYFSDPLLIDENGDVVDEPELLIGDALKRIGEYEPDAVYVRNENTQRDYQILKRRITYAEAFGEDH